ncbi:MAG: diguanylate cyclase [Rhodoferax sp.]|nr:diguanylate cyclase [Rhodoferax sp.]
MQSWTVNDETKRKYSILLLLALVLAGLAGNYFSFPVFFNIDFLFGSVFALLALQCFGRRWGTLAAALIASYTFVLWAHPYAIVIMTAEVALVGTLTRRFKLGLVLADTLYWLIVGMPLVLVFYHFVMKMPLNASNVMMIKQAVNGIANALLANLLLIAFALRSRTRPTSFREIIYSLLAAFVLFPALLLLALDGRADFAATDHTIRTELLQDARRLNWYLETWISNRKSAVQSLALMASSQSAPAMQAHLEQAQRADPNFLRVGLMDSQATVTAYYPLADALGRATIGKNFADRPYIADLKRTLQPMVSEVLLDRVGLPGPMVAVRAPVLVAGHYGGYVTGILSLRQIREQLDQSTSSHSMLYTLLDKNGHIILSNRPDQAVMLPMQRGPGELNRLDAGISQWVPLARPGRSISERWRDSFYVAQSPIGKLSEWQLILEQPVAPFQSALFESYTRHLIELFVLLLGALALAEWLSRRMTRTVDILNVLTHDLPRRLGTDDQEIAWPQTAIIETNHLIGHFREMSELLTVQFDEVQTANEMLEQRVQEQTAALQANQLQLQTIFQTEPECIKIVDAQGRLLQMNPAGLAMIQADSLEQVRGQSVFDLVAPEHRAAFTAFHQRVLAGETLQLQFEVIGLKGGRRWLESHATPMLEQGQRVHLAVTHDITERRQMQEQMRQLAFYDPLTQLPNRRLLGDRLGQTMAASKRSGNFCALMMLDLDNFKPLNDQHGHLAGDKLLVEVARRLSAGVREIDTVTRYGGDEFVVMLGALDTDLATSTAQTAIIAEKIRLSLAEPYLLWLPPEGQGPDRVEHHCSASIGVVLFLGTQAPPEDILKWADQAMYQAKDAGRNRVQFFTPQRA